MHVYNHISFSKIWVKQVKFSKGNYHMYKQIRWKYKRWSHMYIPQHALYAMDMLPCPCYFFPNNSLFLAIWEHILVFTTAGFSMRSLTSRDAASPWKREALNWQTCGQSRVRRQSQRTFLQCKWAPFDWLSGWAISLNTSASFGLQCYIIIPSNGPL